MPSVLPLALGLLLATSEDAPTAAPDAGANDAAATAPATAPAAPPVVTSTETAPSTAPAPGVSATPTTESTTTEPTGPTVATAMWSVGGGAVFGNGLVASSAVERRLLPWLWIHVAGSGGGAQGGTLAGGIGTRTPGETTTNQTDLSASLTGGLRFQLVDDVQIVRPSLVVGVRGNVDRRTTDEEGTREVGDTTTPFSSSTTLTTMGVDAFGGALVDFSLLPWLALRFSTDVASVGLVNEDRTTLATDGDEESESSSSTQRLRGGLSIEPGVSLQAFF